MNTFKTLKPKTKIFIFLYIYKKYIHIFGLNQLCLESKQKWSLLLQNLMDARSVPCFIYVTCTPFQDDKINSHLLPWQSSYGFNKNVKSGFFPFYIVLSFVVFVLLQVVFGEKNYIQELVSGRHAILWGLLEFISWKCLVHTLLHRKRSTVFKLTFCTVQHELY